MKFHWHSYEHFRKHRHGHPILVIGHVFYALVPNRRIRLPMLTNTVGQVLKVTIAFKDQHGSPMQTTPTPDAGSVSWSNTTTLETPAISADGLEDDLTGIAAGLDTLNVSLAVGGTSFAATGQVTVAAEAQVLTSIEIVPVAGP